MSKIGNVKNSVNEGKTNQKILDDKLLTFVESPVSMYSQNIAKTETSGTDAKTAPARELLLEISEIATIRIVVIAIFIA